MWDRFNFNSAVLILLSVPAIAAAQGELRVSRAEVLSYDLVTEPRALAVQAGSAGAVGLVWTFVIPETAPITKDAGRTRTIEDVRVLVTFNPPLPAGHTLRFLDANGTQVESVQTRANPLTEYWSVIIPGGKGRVTLSRDQVAQTPAATIGFAYPVVATEKQSLTPPTNGLMPASQAPPRFQRLGQSVARLRFMIAGEGQATCTAFVVGTRLLLTNQHCMTNDQERASALVDFNYDSRGTPLSNLRVSEVVAHSRELDYALLRLASDPPTDAGRLYFAPSTWKWSTAGQALLIIQHPSGEPKQVSISDCHLDGASRIGVQPGDASDFGHYCDTLGGSSGSPVLDWTTGFVVGLHHFGFAAGAKDATNQAVQYARILADIQTKDATAHADIVRPRP